MLLRQPACAQMLRTKKLAFKLSMAAGSLAIFDLDVGFAQQSRVISHVRGRVPCMKAAQSSLVCDTYPMRVRDPGPSKMVAHTASGKNRLPPTRAILLSFGSV